MNLLDMFSQTGGVGHNLLQMLQALPQASMGPYGQPPALDPALQDMASPDQLAAAASNYQRNLQAGAANATAGGAKFYQVAPDAGQAAGAQYTSDIQNSIKDVAALRGYQSQQRSRAAVAAYVDKLKNSSDPTEQQQGQILGMLDLSDPKLMEQVARNAFPSKPPRNTLTLTPGDGYAYVVDAENGHTIAKVGSGKPAAGATPAAWEENPFKGPMTSDIVDLALPQVLADPTAIKYFAVGRSSKETQPYVNQMNHAQADYLAEHNMKPNDLAGIRAQIMGERKSAVQLTQQLNNLQQFESSERVTANNLLALANKIPDSGSPMINEVIRGAKIRGLGDQDLSDLRAMLTTFIPGVARIVSDPKMLGGVVTQQSRDEIQQMLSGNMNSGQIKRVIGRLLAEMDTRMGSISNQVKAAQVGSAFPGYGQPGAASTDMPQPAPPVNPPVAGAPGAPAAAPAAKADYIYTPGKPLIPVTQ
jgi:hypothetical protein